MKNDLLSIGKVASMKNVSIKGLRYYEKIGILKPAYVNPDTGYRYYSMNQMLALDVIETCLELDIPLKSLTRFIDEKGILDLEALLLEGQSIAIDKIHRSQAALERISCGMREINSQKEVLDSHQVYLRHVPERVLLCTPLSTKTGIVKSYVKTVSSLYAAAEQHQIVALYAQGIALNIHPDLPGWSVYVEALIQDHIDLKITKPCTHLTLTNHAEDTDGASDPYIVLKQQERTYNGRRFVWPHTHFEHYLAELFRQCIDRSDTVIVSDIWSVNPEEYIIEVLTEEEHSSTERYSA